MSVSRNKLHENHINIQGNTCCFSCWGCAGQTPQLPVTSAFALDPKGYATKSKPFPGEPTSSDSSLMPGHFSPTGDNCDGPQTLQRSPGIWPTLDMSILAVVSLPLLCLSFPFTGVGHLEWGWTGSGPRNSNKSGFGSRLPCWQPSTAIPSLW